MYEVKFLHNSIDDFSSLRKYDMKPLQHSLDDFNSCRNYDTDMKPNTLKPRGAIIDG